MTFWDCKLKFL